ncbi:unannotated protein [freshwater metagenome]|uniref:Unannotated protein n=1 Tax=freshwater metagenome TaxID=449393 RepID=A0A6J7AP20_9ZZZZ
MLRTMPDSDPAINPAPDEVTPGPADRLRERLTHGHGRYSVIAGTLTIWIMDTLLTRRLEMSGAVTGTTADIVRTFEAVSTVLFVITSIALIVTLLKPYPRALFPVAAIYLTFSVVQVVANVISMLSSAHTTDGIGLGSLWDVAAVYAMSVSVFMFVYVLLDLATPGGAFVWPARDGQDAPTPNLFDYLFISLNVNSTYGPTSEAVMSRPTKLIMAIQVLLAILMLTVLISRSVAATS